MSAEKHVDEAQPLQEQHRSVSEYHQRSGSRVKSLPLQLSGLTKQEYMLHGDCMEQRS